MLTTMRNEALPHNTCTPSDKHGRLRVAKGSHLFYNLAMLSAFNRDKTGGDIWKECKDQF